MKGNRNPTWGQTVRAFALGATAGSAAALLMAPASGRTTRKRMASRFQAAVRPAARQLRQSGRMLTKRANVLKEAALETIDNGREWILERVPAQNGNSRHHPAPRRVAHRS